mgnify:CR=1 FL=1
MNWTDWQWLAEVDWASVIIQGTLIGGLFNTFPYTSFSQNVGLVGVTGVRSRYVCVAAGLIMVALGLVA